MKKMFGEEYNIFLINIFKELNIVKDSSICYSGSSGGPSIIKIDRKEFHLLSFGDDASHEEENQVSEESLKELGIWWLRYEIEICLSEEPLNYYKLLDKIDSIPYNYTLGDDLIEAIVMATNNLPDFQRSKFFERDRLGFAVIRL